LVVVSDDSREPAATALSGLLGNAPLELLLAETSALFHLLRFEAERMHGEGEFSAGKRSILIGLQKNGPQTVPDMARARPVSRQYMQRLVNELSEQGLVEAVPNPAHKRSSLIAITPLGEERVAEIVTREKRALGDMPVPIKAWELETAAKTIRKVRDLFENADWKEEE
jgi:DNA-binding MarR family transcriptional regulator